MTPPEECIPEGGERTLKLIAITDLDKKARTSVTDWTWRAVKRSGELHLNTEKGEIGVTWDPSSDQNVTTQLNVKGRGMELSDLANFNGHLLSPDDKTGMIYQIEGKKAIPWVFLNSGPGNTTSGMKAEWMTLKDGRLYVGGHGTEYRGKNGEVLSTDPMWIKIVSPSGAVEHKDWTDVYKKIRQAAGFPAPGYLTHEAVQWSDIHQKWFFLPRKHSKHVYDEAKDERRGSNLLISADDNIENIQVVKVGELDNRKRGYAAFEFVPGTCDYMIVAIKSKEIEDSTESYITVFDINGNVLLDDQKLEGSLKFEGLYFV
ncbi:unnamed protein product [Heligmosomoides polygyrus]|uniref:Apyrase n=1 Tax=Heligmosomoides polygyrus TaxID=6339 RepID=A0A3P8BX92_HELPZ|nr:unnamed protein product [Heligmosomoides polygyrus]